MTGQTVAASPQVREPRLHALGPPVALALLSAVFYFFLGFLVLFMGHPDEDAYILFIYSEHLARDGVISYYSGGPAVEGATDFLWMVLIAAISLAGISSGVAAQILNAVGVFVIVFLVANESRRYVAAAPLILIAACAVVTTRFVEAGYVGFSSPLYCALVLTTFVILVRAPRLFVLVPILSILLGLFRPDGVILGVGFTLVGLVLVQAEQRSRYLAAMMAAFVIGVAYFVWRYHVFGYLLPLPLYVKGSYEGVPRGLMSHLDWARVSLGYILPAIGALVLAGDRRARLMWALVPVLLHLAVLGLSETSQNISFRFQAPAGVVLFYLSVVCLGEALERWRAPAVAVPAAAAIGAVVLAFSGLADLKSWKDSIQNARDSRYVATFPIRLAEAIGPEDRIALTEAGRLGYFVRNEKIDLVGLNTPYTARNGSDADYIASFDPDLVYLHTAELLDFSCDHPDFCRLSPDRFRAEVAAAGLRDAEEEEDRVLRATISGLEFLSEHSADYAIFAVHFSHGYDHVYGLSKTASVDAETFAGLLSESFENPREWSYLEGLDVLD